MHKTPLILFASALAIAVAGSAVQAADATPEPQRSTSSQPIPSLWPEEADADGDNMISHEEAMMLSDKAFKRYDFDQSGDISLQEWRAVINDRIVVARQDNPDFQGPADLEGFSANTFRTHDANGDDMITRAEWDTRVETHFTQMDANGDGMIDEPEAGALKKASKKGD